MKYLSLVLHCDIFLFSSWISQRDVAEIFPEYLMNRMRTGTGYPVSLMDFQKKHMKICSSVPLKIRPCTIKVLSCNLRPWTRTSMMSTPSCAIITVIREKQSEALLEQSLLRLHKRALIKGSVNQTRACKRRSTEPRDGDKQQS